MKRLFLPLAILVTQSVASAQSSPTVANITCYIAYAQEFVPRYTLEIKKESRTFIYSIFKTSDPRRLPIQSGLADFQDTDQGQQWTLTLSDGRLIGTLLSGDSMVAPKFYGTLPVRGEVTVCRQN